MTVTRLEQLGKGRYRIYLDGEKAFILYRDELAGFSIQEGSELSEEVYDRILNEVLVKRARLRAMNLLMQHRFTEKKLREKLEAGDYPSEIVEDAVNYVISYGYVDDAAFAADYIYAHRDDRSIARIRQDLAGKGIDRSVIDEALRHSEDLDGPIDEVSQARQLLAKRHFDPDTASYEEIQKNCAFLARKGFSNDVIHKVIKSEIF